MEKITVGNKDTKMNNPNVTNKWFFGAFVVLSPIIEAIVYFMEIFDKPLVPQGMSSPQRLSTQEMIIRIVTIFIVIILSALVSFAPPWLFLVVLVITYIAILITGISNQWDVTLTGPMSIFLITNLLFLAFDDEMKAGIFQIVADVAKWVTLWSIDLLFK